MDEHHDPQETYADAPRDQAPRAYGSAEPGDELMEELRLAAGAEQDGQVEHQPAEKTPANETGHPDGDLRNLLSAAFKADPGAQPVQATAEIRMPAGPSEPARPIAEAARPAAGPTDTVGNMGLLMDVQLPGSIELGRTELSIAEILELRHGSIVELDRLAGEPVDIFVNGQLLAKGEVVVLDERFGVRITSLISERERLENFGS